MKVRILGCSPGQPEALQYTSSYLINDRVAIDAGSLGVYGTASEQAEIGAVFLTHSHADHVASLPIFVENVYAMKEQCPVIYGPEHTLECVRRHLFNDVIWPDFVELSSQTLPFLSLQRMEPEQMREVNGLRFTAIAVDHVVPTFAYLVEDGESAVLFAADSGPTERVWEVARSTPKLGTVFIEASFPNAMRGLAMISGHLTAEMLPNEAAKMPAGMRLIVVHIKPRFRDVVIEELQALGLPGLEIGQCEADYWL